MRLLLFAILFSSCGSADNAFTKRKYLDLRSHSETTVAEKSLTAIEESSIKMIAVETKPIDLCSKVEEQPEADDSLNCDTLITKTGTRIAAIILQETNTVVTYSPCDDAERSMEISVDQLSGIIYDAEHHIMKITGGGSRAERKYILEYFQLGSPEWIRALYKQKFNRFLILATILWITSVLSFIVIIAMLHNDFLVESLPFTMLSIASAILGGTFGVRSRHYTETKTEEKIKPSKANKKLILY